STTTGNAGSAPPTPAMPPAEARPAEAIHRSTSSRTLSPSLSRRDSGGGGPRSTGATRSAECTCAAATVVLVVVVVEVVLVVLVLGAVVVVVVVEVEVELVVVLVAGSSAVWAAAGDASAVTAATRQANVRGRRLGMVRRAPSRARAR